MLLFWTVFSLGRHFRRMQQFRFADGLKYQHQMEAAKFASGEHNGFLMPHVIGLAKLLDRGGVMAIIFTAIVLISNSMMLFSPGEYIRIFPEYITGVALLYTNVLCVKWWFSMRCRRVANAGYIALSTWSISRIIWLMLLIAYDRYNPSDNLFLMWLIASVAAAFIIFIMISAYRWHLPLLHNIALAIIMLGVALFWVTNILGIVDAGIAVVCLGYWMLRANDFQFRLHTYIAGATFSPGTRVATVSMLNQMRHRISILAVLLAFIALAGVVWFIIDPERDGAGLALRWSSLLIACALLGLVMHRHSIFNRHHRLAWIAMLALSIMVIHSAFQMLIDATFHSYDLDDFVYLPYAIIALQALTIAFGALLLLLITLWLDIWRAARPLMASFVLLMLLISTLDVFSSSHADRGIDFWIWLDMFMLLIVAIPILRCISGENPVQAPRLPDAR